MNNIVVLASGAGTTFDNLAALSTKGVIDFKINMLLTNKVNAGCIDVAIKHEIMTVIVQPLEIWDFLPEHTDLVVLAGWLKLLVIPIEWENKVLNIHPSLLPKYGGKGFYGRHVHQAVIESKDHETGCTVHLVDNSYDTGKIIAQRKFLVNPDDTADSLQEKVQRLEKQVYPIAIDSYLKKLKETAK